MYLNPAKVLALLASTSLLAPIGVRAADVIKANNSDDLNLPSSWVGGVPPQSTQVAVWNSVVTTVTFPSLGADASWAGIRIENPGDAATINAGNTLTLGASGIEMGTATADLTLNNALVLGAPQIWNVGPGRTLTIGGAVSGANSITKNGAGTLVLGVANSYTGGTVLNAGVLQLDAAAAAGAGGGITNNGATLRIGANAINVLNPQHVTGTVVVDVNSQAGGALLTGAWSGDGTVQVMNMHAGATLTLGGNGNAGGSMTAFTGTISMGTNAGTLRFNNGGGNNNTGNANATFDLGTGELSFFSRNRNGNVTFGALMGGPSTTIRQGASSSGTSTYSIGGKNIATTFEGRIIDSGTTGSGLVAINKVGTNKLTLTGENTNAGPTTVTSGTLQIGNGGTTGTLGTGAITINNGASLVFDRSDNLLIANGIAGGGTLIKTNSNTLSYQGLNTSAGITFLVGSGTLSMEEGAQVIGKILLNAGTTLAVANAPSFVMNGTLAGNGTVTGALNAGTGGVISPGDANVAGSLTFANGLTLQEGITYAADLSSTPAVASSSDRINVTGDLNITGNVTISINALTTLADGPYTLITYSGALNGSLANLNVSGALGTLSNPAGAIVFTRTPTRPPTDVTWVGDGGANQWDNLISSNWISGVNSMAFVPGDRALFNNVGALNPTVNISQDVAPQSVVVNSTTDYTFTGTGRIVGDATLTKSNSATLTIVTPNNAYTGPTLVSGGTLAITTVAIAGSDSSIGRAGSSPTNLVLINSTLRYDGSSASTDRGATLDGTNVTIHVLNESDNLTIGGTVPGTAQLTKTGPGTLTLGAANSYAGGTVISNGVLALGSNDANSSGSLSGLGPTNAPVTFYGGTLELFGYNGSVGNNYNTVRNPLIVPAGQTGTLRMFARGPSNSGGNSGLQSTLTGSGTLNLVVNYVRDNLSGDWSAFSGVINVTSKAGTGDEMRINNNFGLPNASVILNDGVTLNRADTANTINDIGELSGTALARLALGNAGGANTTWRIGGKNTTATFAGTIEETTSIIKVGTGTWILTGQNSHTGSTTVSNGVLQLGDGVTDGAISASSLITIVAGATLDVSKLSSPILNLNFGQTLAGNGTLLGGLDTQAGGTVSPGLPTGNLTVNNNVILGGTAILGVSRGSTPSSGRLVAPSIQLGGTLVVTNVGGALQAGDTFDLFDGTLSGSFSSFVLPNYYTWNTDNVAVNGTISVVSVLPRPSVTAVDYSQLANGFIGFSGSNGAPNGSYIVRRTTDLGIPISAWTAVETNFFDGAGMINPPLNIPVTPGAQQEFFLIQGL
ncbi:MAG TPA: autotransporter-associated beta strand repeat-containing protein [Verrucomicrobiae bacterium]|nr:autotransporter-associated beta strand repeat-containing protein [Verrucomicrobiae bacterium]